MGKNGGFLTPKAISNRIKAKGLQKLRWYCQSCQKQCRDEVSFRQIDNPLKFHLFR
jgi:DNA/RNA-binding protein KIN17